VNREEAVSSIDDVLGNPSRGLVPYRSGIWNGVPGWQVGRQIFRQVVLGNWPHLGKVLSPSTAFATPPADPDRANGTYPEIVPSDETFLRYIQLLGEHSLKPEIPLALAWMKALNVEPRRMTLAMALGYWGEFSFRPPLVERWSSEKSEYTKLRDWIAEWVPPRKVPGDGDVARSLKFIALIREGRNPSVTYHHHR
jgi:hypothetical protein